MIGALIFLAFGYAVILNGDAFKMAAFYAVTSLVLSLIFGASILDAAIGVVLVFAYASLVYYLVERFSQQIFLPLLILITGAFILIFWI